MPAFSQSKNRWWIALALPNTSFGNAFHWHPVRSTYTMPSNTVRAGFGLRPPPALRLYVFSGLRCDPGISASTQFQNASDTTQLGNRFMLSLRVVFKQRPHEPCSRELQVVYG
jgi:hypothetical protein